MTIDAHCHCENIRMQFDTDRALTPVECPCRFCRTHGAIYVADTEGDIRITVADPDALIRYRFGEDTTVYLICRRCGGFAAALIESDGGVHAAMNLSLTGERHVPAFADEAWRQQSAAERVEFRRARWTPATLEGFSLKAG